MSTKIYNGYRIPCMSLAELHSFMQDLTFRVRAEARVIYTQWIARQATSVVDAITLGYAEKTYRHGILVESVWDTNKLLEDNSHPLSLDFSVVIIPIPKKILCLVYTTEHRLREIWDSMPGVEEYAYWDNTDRPDELTEGQWRRRAHNWGLALPGYEPSNVYGMTIECISQGMGNFHHLPSTNELLPHVPSIRDRTLEAAYYTLKPIYLPRIKAEREREGKDTSDWATERAYTVWLKTAGNIVFEEEKKRVRELLPQEITRDLLFDKWWEDNIEEGD